MDNIPEGAIPIDEAETSSASNQDIQQDPSGAPGTPMAQPVQQQAIPEGAIPVDDTHADTIPEGAIPVQGIHKDLSKYDNNTDTFRAGEEAFLRNNTFGGSDWALDHFGNDTETAQELSNRQEAHPIASAIGAGLGLATSMATGVGEAGLLAKGAKALFPIAEEAGALANIGSKALRAGIEMSGMASGDELSDAFLGHDKDGLAIAGHIVGAGALGILTGGFLGGGQEGLKTLANKKLGTALTNMAIGLGAASKGEEAIEEARKTFFKNLGPLSSQVPKAFENGVKLQDWLSKKIAAKVTDLGLGAAAGALGGIGAGGAAYGMAEHFLSPILEKATSKYSSAVTNKVAIPMLLKAVQAGKVTGLIDALNYGAKAAKGAKLIGNTVDSLFKIGGSKGIDLALDPKADEKLDKYISNGGANQQLDDLKTQDDAPQYAEGGNVTPKPVQSNSLASLYPEQNTLLYATKGRVANYLNQLRPQEQSKLTYDTAHKDTHAEKSYRRALTIANQPLKVLQELQKGTLRSDDMKHLISMYPDLHDHLAKKLTAKITEQQLKGEKPSLKIQQGLSLFLGAPLSKGFTPQGIVAAQSAFIPQQPQQGPGKSTKNLSKIAEESETPDQSRTQKKQK